MQCVRVLSHTIRKGSRFFSTAGVQCKKETLQCTQDDKTGVVTITLQSPPVNTLGLQLLTDLGECMTQLKQNKCKGVIITSAIPNIFTAGLDLMEFYNTNQEKLEKYWRTLQNSWLQLYTSPFPTVALINGQSPAGGCLVAMSCEYRVIVGRKYCIGLNEAKIGIPAPFWFMDVMRNTIGHRNSELALFEGALYPADEALKIGLIDVVTDDQIQAAEKVNAFFSKQFKTDGFTRGFMKKMFRQDLVDKFNRERENELKYLVPSVLADATQQKLEMYIRAMKQKK